MHLALAPKSNSAYAGLGRAVEQVRSGPVGEVPPHLRDGSYRSAAGLGHGVGYEYPTTTRAAGSPSATCPLSWKAPPTTGPAGTDARARVGRRLDGPHLGARIRQDGVRHARR
ncbi:MAG: hypothetical protein R2789_03810 [Microthrixaceae bacterium]